MGNRAVVLHFLLLLLLLLHVKKSLSQTNQSCNSNDRSALRDFSMALDAAIDGWGPNGSSPSMSDCCSWPGVICDVSALERRVVGLNLANMSLKGFVSGSLVNLDQLRELNLSSNSLGGAIPAKLFRLPKLEYLDLSVNRLAGSIPGDASLPAIRVFNVSFNALNGSLPVLAGSGSLTAFDASANAFSGAVTARMCNSSRSVRVIRLSMNKLTGEVPAGFRQCRSLAELALDVNGLTGGLPDDLFELASLQDLRLHGNSLTGAMSAKFRKLSNLTHLDLSFNGFSGKIPEIFDNLKNLEEFYAESNDLSGELPASLSNCSRLRVLNLRNNSLTGDIALDFAALPRLVYLDLGLNGFTGRIPASLPRCTEMTALNLGRNNLVGGIPGTFRSFVSLSFLSLTGNNFSDVASALRILQELPNLSSVVLTKNFRGGEVMPSAVIAPERFKNLEVFVLANCALSGSIPPWLARLDKLKVLDISWNHLTGSVPPWLGDFEHLFYLDISNNSLTGEIPSRLTQMRALTSSGSDGSPAPAVPVQDFPFFIRRNSTGKGLQYNQVSSFPPSLVLGHNHLTGGISPRFGALVKLHVLDLSWNGLSGTIPAEISNMSSLESLDLSHNNLTGGIPNSLTKLSFLSSFDVAHNNLSGEIPAGGQFSTFSREDFEGNPGLCGNHIAQCNATPSAAATEGKEQSRKDRDDNVVIATAIAVGTFLLLVVIVLAMRGMRTKRREDNAKVAADDDDTESAQSATVVLFQNKDDIEGELTLDDILKSTGNFDQSHIIGCGGFGMVYKATLPDGRTVAIKRLSGDFCQMEREFRAEVETLSRVRHDNLVVLRGYCRIGSDRLLIYSFMQNGSLDYWLHERDDRGAALAWPTRLNIARGAARGLAYLHQSCEPRILHRDIKSSNILLDEAFDAHLADFGLARLILPQDSHVTTDLVGTLGYIPPEYGHSPVATYRGDVYSFGVVLLELVTGRRPVDMCMPRDRRDIVSWVLRTRKERRETDVIDATMYEKRYQNEVLRALDIACLCVSENPKSRPSSEQLVAWLDDVSGGA